MAEAETTLTEERAMSRMSSRGARLAAASITLSVLGVGMIPILTLPLASKALTAFSLPPWAPVAAIGITGAVFAAAIILAIVSQSVSGRSIHRALLWAISGLAVWLVLLGATWLVRGFGTPYEPTSLYSQELIDSPVTMEHPLPFGAEVVVSELGTRQPVMIVTAEEPLTVTQEAIDAGAPPPDGDYIAVPVAVEVVDPTGVARGVTLPDRRWVSHDRPEWPAALTIPGYPGLDDLDLSGAGVHRVYDFYDTSAFETGQGAYLWWLLGPGSDGAYWGESIDDFFPQADSAQYGTWIALQSTVTGDEVGRVTVHTPVDVTDAVKAASLPAPANGAFFACPIVVEIDRAALTDPDAAIPLPDLIFMPPEGTQLDSPPFPLDRSLPEYPTGEEMIGTDVASEFAYYGIFDIPPETADKGSCVIFLGAIGSGLDYTIDFGPG